MASIKGLKDRLNEWKPRIASTFVVYLEAKKSPIDPKTIDTSFTMVTVTSPDDPLLPKLTSSKRQLKIARDAIASGHWDILVALDADGEPAGRIWQTFDTERALAHGVPRMKLAADEVLMFDLFVARQYRRSGIAMTMADAFFRRYDPDVSDMKLTYAVVTYENAPSILWHHSVGFTIVQTVNLLEIGPFIRWKIPFSDVPRFGPMSRKGRHTNPERELFGPALLP